MKKLLYFLFFVCSFIACEETNVPTNTTTAPNTSTDNTVAATPAQTEKATDEKVELSGKELEFDKFNLQIKQATKNREEWSNSPLSIMLQFTGANMDSNVKSIRSKKLGPGENIENVIVTVEEDGLMDDSVSGTISILRMKKVDGTWQVYKATRAWKCWKGRGHETYGGEPCG